ncbi:MAG: PadR family transcriptional regulator [Anaerolineae bacterium]|nr:PadR family transcriptional regulator [Anaerolineae bacterium]
MFRSEIIRELERHGNSLCPETLYPTLHRLEKDGYLVSEKRIAQAKVRKPYRATLSVQDALKKASIRAVELM